MRELVPAIENTGVNSGRALAPIVQQLAASGVSTASDANSDFCVGGAGTVPEDVSMDCVTLPERNQFL